MTFLPQKDNLGSLRNWKW